MTRNDPFTQPVQPANTPRSKRRDPDATPQTAAADTTPSAAATTIPTTPAPAADLAPTTPPTGGTLGPVLAPTTTGASTSDTGHDSVSVLLGLARMRNQQPTDPMNDYITDGTRKLKFIQRAIQQISQLTGRTRQDVETRALLGIEPLPQDVLEANWQALYGYPRAQYQPPGNHR